MRQLLTPPGSRAIDNGTLLNTMCDMAHKYSWRSSSIFHSIAACSIALLPRVPYLRLFTGLCIGCMLSTIMNTLTATLYLALKPYEYTVHVFSPIGACGCVYGVCRRGALLAATAQLSLKFELTAILVDFIWPGHSPFIPARGIHYRASVMRVCGTLNSPATRLRSVYSYP